MSQRVARALLANTAAVVMLLAGSCTAGSGRDDNIDFTWLAATGDDIVFDATQLVNGEEITSFHWDFGDGQTQTTTQDVIHHQYAAAGDYTVTLTGSDAASNQYEITHTVSASP